MFPEHDHLIRAAGKHPQDNFIGIDQEPRGMTPWLARERGLTNLRCVFASDENVFQYQSRRNREILDEVLVVAPGKSNIFLLHPEAIEAVATLLKPGGEIHLALEEENLSYYGLDFPQDRPRSLLYAFERRGISLVAESHESSKPLFEFD